MPKEDPTPLNNQLVDYRLDELKETCADLKRMCQEILVGMESQRTDFNNHVREDDIRGEHVKLLLEEKQSNSGMWAGLGGVAAGVGSFIYALFGGGK